MSRLHPEGRERVPAAVEKKLKSEEPYCLECRVKRKDGTYLCWLDRGSVVYDDHEFGIVKTHQGLQGDAILLEARILAVADVVETMVSHRSYRPAIGLEAALEEISANQGILYDADVVDACLRVFKERGFRF